MSEPNKITLSLPDAIFEDLQCFMCKGYLSCSPLRLLPDGNNICGRCLPVDTNNGPIHRLLSLEAVLSKMSFPCVFKNYGCSELLLFGKTTEHESKCVHKPFGCPTNASGTCPWEGNAAQLFQHFQDAHFDFVKEKIEFQLNLNDDAEGFLMAVIKALPFLLKYSYKSKERSLRYDVRCCCNNNGNEVSWKTQLINANDLECSSNLKMNTCLSYDESFCGSQFGKVLDLTKFLESLDDPDSIIVAVNFKIVELNVTTVDNCNAIEEQLKCHICCNYLLPPLFELNGKIICGDCSEIDTSRLNAKPCEDANLLGLVNEAACPCRWRECNFVGKSNGLKEHETNCEFRVCLCIYSNCHSTFRLNATANHLQTHANNSTVYIPGENKIIYTTSIAQEYEAKHILTIKNLNIILVLHKCTMLNKNSEQLRVHEIRLSSRSRNNITGIVQFEHDHCKVSKIFKIPYLRFWLQVALKELPPCFKETDELTVTVDVI